MKRLIAKNHHSVEEIKEYISSIKGYNDVVDYKIIQCIKTVPEITAEEIARVLCISVKKVYGIIQAYNKEGKGYKQNKQWGGRRQATSYLSPDREMEILSQIQDKAHEGLILTAKDIKHEFEKEICKEVSDDYIWDVFKRNKWTKKSPSPEPPKTDNEKQEDFKKNSLKTWRPAN